MTVAERSGIPHNPTSMKKSSLAVLLALAGGAAAWAHDEKSSVSRIDVSGHGIVWRVDVSIVGLEKVLKLPADPIDLSESQLQGLKGDIVAYLKTCMKVEINGKAAEPEAGALEPVYEPFIATGEKYIAHARQEMKFTSPDEIRKATLSAAFFRTKTDEHHAVLDISWGGSTRTFSRFGPFDLDLTPSRIHPTLWSTGSEFFLLGTHRMLFGACQIAFVLGLALAARRLPELGRVIVSFAVAHTLALLLAEFARIRLNSSVTALLIAVSVLYVGAENYFLKEGRHRWVLAFTFGLVHGLGFSDSLKEDLRDLESVVWPLASFDAGLLLGELAILLAVFPVFSWIRKAPGNDSGERRQRLLVRWGSALVVLVGAYAVAEQVFLRGRGLY